MGILAKIRRALEKHEVSAPKKKIARLEIDATKVGKTVESLTIVVNTRSGSLSNRFEFVLSDGTTNKQKPKRTGKNNPKNPNRVAPVGESESEPGLQPTLVGRSCDYDEKSVSVEDYEEAGVKVYRVVRRDGVKDILKVTFGKTTSVPQAAIWWIENEEKVCNKLNVTATPPSKGPLISLLVKMIKI